jgi:glutaredoxin
MRDSRRTWIWTIRDEASRSRRGLLAACVALSLALSGCRSRGAGGDAAPTVSAEHSADAAPAVPFAVRDDATELMFFWFDPQGGAHAVRRVDEVPAERREVVRVDPSRPEQRAAGWVYVADLRQRGPSGSYPARAVPAEALASQVLAMAGHVGALGSPPAAAPSALAGADGGAVAQRPAVIIYGASWCSACHQAADYLRRRHVAFVEKDIEQDPAAAQEMMDKARRAGVPTGSIPILDVRGRIMAGFSAPAIESALGG